jgi:lysophospholipase L1-like esterase
MKTHNKGISFITLALAFAGAARGEESVAGKWKGQFDSQIGLQKYTYELRVDGDKLTGKATGEREMGTNEVAITEGKISTNEIFFVEPLKFGDQEIRIEYKGKFSGDEIKFHRKVGDVAEEDFVANRVKESPAADTGSSDGLPYPEDASLLPGKGPAQTWNDFPKVWSQRHAEWQQSRSKEIGAVVFLGDSITQGWNSLANDFPNLQVANRGIGGDTTRGVLYRLKADVLDLKPAAVVLLIGTNDIGLGGDPDEIADNIRQILLALKNFNPDLPVIVCKVMPRADRDLHPAEKIKKLNATVEAFVKSEPKFTECDTWSIYADENGNCKKGEFPDLLHPNRAGYDKWEAALKPIFAKLNLGTEKTH